VSAGLYVVWSRRPLEHDDGDRVIRWSGWRSDEIGNNEPRPREECEENVESLRGLGHEWAEADYRIERADS
jgi:hypothetical protein